MLYKYLLDKSRLFEKFSLLHTHYYVMISFNNWSDCRLIHRWHFLILVARAWINLSSFAFSESKKKVVIGFSVLLLWLSTPSCFLLFVFRNRPVLPLVIGILSLTTTCDYSGPPCSLVSYWRYQSSQFTYSLILLSALIVSLLCSDLLLGHCHVQIQYQHSSTLWPSAKTWANPTWSYEMLIAACLSCLDRTACNFYD